MIFKNSFIRKVRGLVSSNWTKINCNSMTQINGLATSCSNKTKNNIPLDLEINRLVWVDLEMTGLNIDSDRILEVACLVTDSDLNIIAEGPNIVIHQPKDILENMNPWCIKQHGKTGLTEESLKSNITIKEAEDIMFQFVSKHTTANMSPLVGNSVYMDRLFLMKHMPRFNSHLHYRIIDVSSIKELCRRWNPVLYKNVPKKGFGHRALADIKECVEELKFYESNFFKI